MNKIGYIYSIESWGMIVAEEDGTGDINLVEYYRNDYPGDDWQWLLAGYCNSRAEYYAQGE